jgi:hypothetical protein
MWVLAESDSQEHTAVPPFQVPFKATFGIAGAPNFENANPNAHGFPHGSDLIFSMGQDFATRGPATCNQTFFDQPRRTELFPVRT